MAFPLPRVWELLHFSRSTEQGRCLFADRYRFRFEISWRRAPGQPDFDRMMSDYRHELESRKELNDIHAATLAGCPGLIGRSVEGKISRFGKWFRDPGLLVETVFLWDEQRNKEVERTVLSGLRTVGPDSQGLLPWRAFGMEIQAPATWRLESCKAEAASAGFVFRGRSPAETWIFRRYGMLDSWLKTDLSTWLLTQIPADIRRPAVSGTGDSSANAVHVSGRYVPKGLLRKRGNFHAAAWREQQDDRLYACMLTTPRSSPYAAIDPAACMKAAPEFTEVPE